MTAPAATRITPEAVQILPPGVDRTDRERWLDVRRAGIGGSDVAALLGLDRHHGPRHVYEAKRGHGGDPDNEAMKWGRRLEAPIAEGWAEDTGAVLLPPLGTLAHVEQPWMQANVDRLVLGPPAPGEVIAPVFGPNGEMPDDAGPLEIKNKSERMSNDWGEDDLPDEPALQAHWYLAVTGYTTAYVAALLGGNRLRWYRLERDQELIDHIVSYAAEFWVENVQAGRPPAPDGSKATTELLAHLWDVTPDAIAEVDETDANVWRARRNELRAAIGELSERLAEVENAMRDATGAAEIAMAGGRTVWTWKANGTLATKRFRAEQPELVAAYRKQVTATDWAAIAEDHPDIYRRYRARVLRVPER